MTNELLIELSIKDQTVSYTLYETTIHSPTILFGGSFKMNPKLVYDDMPVSEVLTFLKDPVIVSITNHCVITSHTKSIDLSDPKDPVSHALNYLVEKISSFYSELAAYDPEA